MGIRERIRELENDLSAEIVIQEEKGHYEETVDTGYIRNKIGCGHGQADWDPAAGDSWVSDETKSEVAKVIEESKIKKYYVDVPKIAKPDKQKREKARIELQQIYNASKGYQFIRRYLVKNILEKST